MGISNIHVYGKEILLIFLCINSEKYWSSANRGLTTEILKLYLLYLNFTLKYLEKIVRKVCFLLYNYYEGVLKSSLSDTSIFKIVFVLHWVGRRWK